MTASKQLNDRQLVRTSMDRENELTGKGAQSGVLQALLAAQAVIEFNLDGTVIAANENFLEVMGYELEEIQGKHHRMFCSEQQSSRPEYEIFWENLREGESISKNFSRVKKSGEIVWLKASYNPVYDEQGELKGIVKFAVDITESVLKQGSDTAMLAALDRVQAVIEFDVEGNILRANENFLSVTGYKLAEIVGKHHRIFCDPEYTATEEYQQFWATLGGGEFVASEFKRITKTGDEIWINASYNPVFDAENRVTGVIKYATDITESIALKTKAASIATALDRVQAVIEFDVEGKILRANENFLSVTGYQLEEVVGRHHRIFCDPEYVSTDEYQQFWGKLRSGEFVASEFRRFTKTGKEVWINASYNPVFDTDNRVVGVIKYATDITASKREQAEASGKIDAIERSQAVIEFTPEGDIIRANENFLAVTGYEEGDIIGQHHSIFCEKIYTESHEYREFWKSLKGGDYSADEYKRITRTGEEIWINASYNPVFDASGRVSKVVKFASDITQMKTESLENAGKMAALNRSRAIIEFDLDGNIITANEAFLSTLNYQLKEIIGKHHSMFCKSDYVNSPEYKDFWANLKSGNFDSGRYMRLARDNSEVWINASYNPIFDADGKAYKVVKFASDISSQVEVEKNVRRLAGEFSHAATVISERSSSVASSAQSLGANTEEMNAAVEELTASIDSIASNSKNADGMARTTQIAAEHGAKAISDSIEAMDLINKSAEGIGEIVMVISEIASQTNLLAFNAAIEAARAGEHGLGFSVVADEVRKLAERSSQATKEITQLINESIKRVNQGSATSQEAVKSFKEIVGGVDETTRAISEISCAAEEQLIAAREVSTAIQQISEASESSAATAESIAQATTELTTGAEELTDNANKFVA